MRILYLILILIFSSQCFAAPAITGYSGSLIESNSITLTGTAFGSSGPSIVIFDDFEKGTATQPISTAVGSATISEWTDLGPGDGEQIHYTIRNAHSGTKAAEATHTETSSQGKYANKDFSGTKEFFGTWWVFLPTECNWPGEDTTHNTNWKQTWFLTNTASDGSDVVVSARLWATGGAIECGGTIFGNHMGGYYAGAGIQSKGVWRRIAFYWVGSGSAAGICKHESINYDGTNTVTVDINDTGLTNMDNGADSYIHCHMHGYGRNHIAGQYSYNTFDDFYLATGANCRARVEIGDNASYYNCTNLAICTVTSWSDTEVVFTARGGSFSRIGGNYLFVIDANGSISAGYHLPGGQVEIGGTKQLDFSGSPTKQIEFH